MGGKFAGLVLVSLPVAGAATLEAELKALSSRGLSVRVTPTGDSTVTATAGRGIALTVMGPDRLGIVREIASALAQRDINVIEMDSEVSSAPMSAEMMFHARIEARIPENTDMDELSDTLEEIANQMTLDIDLE